MAVLKLCGLRKAEEVALCERLGVEYAGFVAYPPSPRHIEPAEFQALAALCRRVTPVLVTVDASDEMLDAYLTRHCNDGFVLQLHGNETPERLSELKNRHHCRIIKAISDPAQAALYVDSADFLLIDAPPAAGELPGGNAKTVDWQALQGFSPALPWFLSGGLTAQNVAEALRVTSAKMFDVSSGVERKRGVKDAELIKEFVHAARI